MFNVAYNNFQKKLNVHASFKVSDRALAEDLVQDTFMKTWSYLVKGGKIETMKAFLYHVLNGCIIDQYRKKNKTISPDALVESGFEPDDDNQEHVFNLSDGKSAVRLILLLPLKYQKIMNMRYVEDLSAEEISSRTGQSKNAVAVNLHRGLEKLKFIYRPAMALNAQ